MIRFDALTLLRFFLRHADDVLPIFRFDAILRFRC